jgi:hypothetical protein
MAEDVYDLVSAMEAGDVLAEAERRYEIVAEMLDPRRELAENERPITGTEVKALSIEADRLMEKIVRLRNAKKSDEKLAEAQSNVVSMKFDANRFAKSG